MPRSRSPLHARPSRSSFSKRLLQASAVFGACLLSSCVTVPQYDATTDASLSSVQSEIDAKMVELSYDVRSKNPADNAKATYAQNAAFYSKVDTDLESLELRMEAVPDASNKNLPAIFGGIREMLTNFENTQQQLDAEQPPRLMAAGTIQTTRNQFNAAIAPLITYELMLKGVSSPKTADTSSTATKTASAKAASAN